MPTFVFAGYGAMCLAAAAFALQLLTSAPFILASGMLVVTCCSLKGTAPHSGRTCSQRERNQRMRAAVVIIASVSITTAAVILGLLRLSNYLPGGTVVLVGVHLLPDTEFHWTDRWTGLALVVWCLGCFLVSAPSHVAVAAELGAGIVFFAAVFLRRSLLTTAIAGSDS